ncbi:hypothetical protein CCP3SC1AL1_1830006 [Gammaproteobacteria bacterium]
MMAEWLGRLSLLPKTIKLFTNLIIFIIKINYELDRNRY